YKYIKESPVVTWETNPLYTFSEPVTPLEQLAMVIPSKSIQVLPAQLRSLYTESSSIFDLMPESFYIDTYGKMEEFQAVVLVPIPNSNRVIRAVAMLNLPDNYRNKYNAQEKLVIIRNIHRVKKNRTRRPKEIESQASGRGSEEYPERGRGFQE